MLANKGEKKCDNSIKIISALTEFYFDFYRIYAHKVILAASSEYFSNLFSAYGSTTRKITLENIHFSVAYALVKYCYTGTISK